MEYWDETWRGFKEDRMDLDGLVETQIHDELFIAVAFQSPTTTTIAPLRMNGGIRTPE